MNQRCTNIAARRALYADEAGMQAKFASKIYLVNCHSLIYVALSQEVYGIISGYCLIILPRQVVALFILIFQPRGKVHERKSYCQY